MRRPRDYVRGAVLLMTMMIMGTAALAGFLALSRATIGRIVDADQLGRAASVRSKTYGCLEEALIHVQADQNWAKTTVTTGDATCTVTVTTPQTGQRLLKVRYSENSLNYGLDVVIIADTAAIGSITATLP